MAALEWTISALKETTLTAALTVIDVPATSGSAWTSRWNEFWKRWGDASAFSKLTTTLACLHWRDS
jgi:hypothetical protein